MGSPAVVRALGRSATRRWRGPDGPWTVPGAMPSTSAVRPMSRSRNRRRATTCRCRAGNRIRAAMIRGSTESSAALSSGAQVRHRARIGYRYLPATAPPAGKCRVQRGADHPRDWCRMPAHRAPAEPSAGQRPGQRLHGPCPGHGQAGPDGEARIHPWNCGQPPQSANVGNPCLFNAQPLRAGYLARLRHGRIVNRSCRDQYLTCDTVGGLERVRVAELGVSVWVADLRADTGSEHGLGPSAKVRWFSVRGSGGRPRRPARRRHPVVTWPGFSAGPPRAARMPDGRLC